MPTTEAVRIARERNLDLVEVAPTGTPPVCRLLDYGRFRYEQAKKERDARKHQHNIVVREVRFHPKIGVHDLDMKVKQAQRLLQEGDKVKVSVLFRGREMSHPELGRSLLARVANELKSDGILEKPVEMEGRNMNIIVAPNQPKYAKTPEDKEGPGTNGAPGAAAASRRAPARASSQPGSPGAR
jgi:translation initiation factor IF-3